MTFPSFLLFLSLISSLYVSQATQCIGLALQGGGDKGAYHAGALAALINNTAAGATQYDVVTGVGIGAPNAAWISQFPKGQEIDMANGLLDLWQTINNSDIYKEWLGGVVQGILFEPSIFDTRPGMEYLQNLLTKPPQRFIALGATNLDNGTYKAFNNFDFQLDQSDFVEGVMASLALPGFFPYQVINDTSYSDGGAVMSVDVDSAITKCREITGGDDASITIDVILLTPLDFKADNASTFTSLQMLKRTLELTNYHTAVNGLAHAKDVYPDVNWRYLVQPSEALPETILPIQFSHDDIVKMINLGVEDAKASIYKGESFEFIEFFNKAEEKLRRGKRRRTQPNFFEQYMKEFNFIRERLRQGYALAQ